MATAARVKKDEVAEMLDEEKDEGGRTIVIPQQKLRAMLIRLKGTTPLITHRFSEKARRQIRETQAKTAQKGAKSVRGPAEIAAEIMACHYPVEGREGIAPENGRFGFPSSGFKSASFSAAVHGTGLFKSRVKCLYFVTGELVPIYATSIDVREDAVRLENGVVQLRYRPYYAEGWSAEIGIRFMPDAISPDQIVNLFDLAGSAVGIGENRAGKTGNTYGSWAITGVEPCALDDLPDFHAEIEDNDILSEAREIARQMGALS
jgi:hypothetical protein